MILNKNTYQNLYGKNVSISSVDKRINHLIEEFDKEFKINKKDSILLFSSPGRAEIGGNHTDHQKGFAVAAALNLDILAVVRRRDDMIFNIYSDGFNKVSVDLSSLDKKEEEIGCAPSLVRGVAKAMSISGLKIGGADVISQSTVVRASGLLSSAAFEVLIANIISYLYNDDCLSPSSAAKAGWWAENNYYGKPCGMMDQNAVAHGGIILFDASCGANGKATKIPTKFVGDDFSFIITNTNSEHSDITDAYAAIVDEMKAVSSYFGKSVLSEISKNDFISSVKEIRKTVKNDRAILRAIHFYSENERAKAMHQSLIKNNTKEFLKLINESGDSSFEMLQNIYVDRMPNEQSVSIAIGLSKMFLEGKKGAVRIQGGGFGGCIQSYIPKADKKEYIALMDSVFGKGSARELCVREEKAGFITELKI